MFQCVSSCCLTISRLSSAPPCPRPNGYHRHLRRRYLVPRLLDIATYSLEPGLGYYFKVTDKVQTNVSGESYPFELLPALPSNSTEISSPEFRDDVGGEGGTGDMSLGLVIMAVVCGERQRQTDN